MKVRVYLYDEWSEYYTVTDEMSKEYTVEIEVTEEEAAWIRKTQDETDKVQHFLHKKVDEELGELENTNQESPKEPA